MAGLVLSEGLVEHPVQLVFDAPVTQCSSKGALVTIDAMGCQRDIAEEIVAAGGDYLLAVKDNQPTLSHELDRAFQDTEDAEDFDELVDFAETSERGHGRTEVRRCLVLRDLGELPSAKQWSKLTSFIRIISERTVGNKTTEEVRNYICSRRLSAVDALVLPTALFDGVASELGDGLGRGRFASRRR